MAIPQLSLFCQSVQSDTPGVPHLSDVFVSVAKVGKHKTIAADVMRNSPTRLRRVANGMTLTVVILNKLIVQSTIIAVKDLRSLVFSLG